MKNNIPILLFGLLIFSCSPSKKVSDQNADINNLKEQFAQERAQIESRAVYNWIKTHPMNCPEYNLDSLCALYYPRQDNPVSPADYTQVNTPISSGTVSPVRVTDPSAVGKKPSEKPQRILVPFENTEKIKLYLDSISAKESYIKILESQQKMNDKNCQEKIDLIKSESKEDDRFWKILFFSLLAAEILRIIIKYKFKVSWL